jgi:deoxyribodipyrimidine photo-lyase
MNASMKFKKGLFIFRRDLRLADNTALNTALEMCQIVIPAFILDPCQVGETNNYRSENALQFMFESLDDLAGQLQEKKAELYIFFGPIDNVVERLLHQEKIDAVFCNKDYTPFSLKRDQKLERLCIKHGVTFVTKEDVLLNNPDAIKTGNGQAFSIFTPFYKQSITFPVALPHTSKNHNFYKEEIAKTISSAQLKRVLPYENQQCAIRGGTHQALKKLKHCLQFKNYARERDFPALETTRLSAHNKFGTVSIRQVYHSLANSLGPHHPLLRQLYWRDFFTMIAYFSPFVFGHPFRSKFEHLPWDYSKKNFARWCEGETGFPIVDAGMRELNETGFMHNRVRMIVASFLTKDLHINWQWGEKYFAQQLVDYDPCVNNGNWQWIASTGADAQPYFRIFNPWLQQKKFDSQCEYIKKWIPELRSFSPATIHCWFEQKTSSSYPKPMLDHDVESKKAKKMYANLHNA